MVDRLAYNPPVSVRTKLAALLGFALAVAALPDRAAPVALLALPALGLHLARKGPGARGLWQRFAVTALGVLCVSLPALAGTHGLARFFALFAKGAGCAAAAHLFALTTPWSELLVALRRAGAPGELVTTLGLAHSYLFVLGREAERMRRARASRTLRAGRVRAWRSLGAMLGQLFVRAMARSERVHAAMRARGLR